MVNQFDVRMLFSRFSDFHVSSTRQTGSFHEFDVSTKESNVHDDKN